MKPDQLFEELKDLAEKLQVIVSEQSFKATGIPVKSGFCVVKGDMHCILDRNIGVYKKNQVLAEALADLPHEHLYIVPAVRDFLIKQGKKKVSPRAEAGMIDL